MWKKNIPKEDGAHQTVVLVLCGLSLVFYLLARFLPLGELEVESMHRASKIMTEALATLKQCRHDKGLLPDKEKDPNQTGLIGLEFSPLTTSRGSLGAKRTTTNPAVAGLLVHLLTEAGIHEGDSIAVGASGSFPALIVATLSAAKAMRARVLPIYSVGASKWGANELGFTWLDMGICLQEAGWLDAEPVAISLGGEKDVGEDWSPELRGSMEEKIVKSGAVFLRESDLRRNVETRMKLYERSDEIRAFINIGGAWANMGESPDILKLGPGLAEIEHLPPMGQRGVIYEMADRGVPVIHLLYIRGLVERYGLPWDPVPLPEPGEGDVHRLARQKDPVFLVLAATYLSLVVFTLILRARMGDRAASLQ